jgi:hypothetical protein
MPEQPKKKKPKAEKKTGGDTFFSLTEAGAHPDKDGFMYPMGPYREYTALFEADPFHHFEEED